MSVSFLALSTGVNRVSHHIEGRCHSAPSRTPFVALPTWHVILETVSCVREGHALPTIGVEGLLFWTLPSGNLGDVDGWVEVELQVRQSNMHVGCSLRRV